MHNNTSVPLMDIQDAVNANNPIPVTPEKEIARATIAAALKNLFTPEPKRPAHITQTFEEFKKSIHSSGRMIKDLEGYDKSMCTSIRNYEQLVRNWDYMKTDAYVFFFCGLLLEDLEMWCDAAELPVSSVRAGVKAKLNEGFLFSAETIAEFNTNYINNEEKAEE